MSDNDIVAWICVIAIVGLAFVLFGVWNWWLDFKRKNRK